MRDVLVRLMQWMETSEIEDAHIVLRDAITEIVRLRTQVDMLRDEVARLRLTDEDKLVYDEESARLLYQRECGDTGSE